MLPIVLNLRPDPECLVQCNTIILPWIPQNTVNLNKICILWENVPEFYPCYLKPTSKRGTYLGFNHEVFIMRSLNIVCTVLSAQCIFKKFLAAYKIRGLFVSI